MTPAMARLQAAAAAAEVGGEGSGPPLLLVHSLLNDSSAWDQVAPALEERRYLVDAVAPEEAAVERGDVCLGLGDNLATEREQSRSHRLRGAFRHGRRSLTGAGVEGRCTGLTRSGRVCQNGGR